MQIPLNWFLDVLGSVEGRVVSANASSLLPPYAFAYPSWNVLLLGMFGVSRFLFVNKGSQS